MFRLAIRRRQFVSLCLAKLTSGSFCVVKPRKTIAVGAIRWDAWSAGNSLSNAAVARSLSPPEFQSRAPFCAKLRAPLNSLDLSDCDSARTVDLEIAFAERANIDFWAYCWYGDTDPMMEAWRFHQSSRRRDDVKWCLLLQLSRLDTQGDLEQECNRYSEFFQQSNYKAIGLSPLVFLYLDNILLESSVSTVRLEQMRTTFEQLRKSCSKRGLSSPYVVVMNGDPKTAAMVRKALRADGISNYMGETPGDLPASYEQLDASVRRYWRKLAATGSPIVPICMTGWDTRPRRKTPPPWQHAKPGAIDLSRYVEAGTAAQIANHILAAIKFCRTYPDTCPAEIVLIYSWNECDEGGSALVPTFDSNGYNDQILSAVGDMIAAN